MFVFLNEIILLLFSWFRINRAKKAVLSLAHSVWHSIRSSQLFCILKSLSKANQIQNLSSRIESPGFHHASLWGKLFSPQIDHSDDEFRENRLCRFLNLILFNQKRDLAHNTVKICSHSLIDSNQSRYSTNASHHHFRSYEISAFATPDSSTTFDQI